MCENKNDVDKEYDLFTSEDIEAIEFKFKVDNNSEYLEYAKKTLMLNNINDNKNMINKNISFLVEFFWHMCFFILLYYNIV